MTGRSIEYQLVAGGRDGSRVAFLLAVAPDDAPPAVREGIARRNAAAIGDGCPCGCRIFVPSRAQRRRDAREGRPSVVAFVHDDACPATDANLTAATNAWLAEGGDAP